MNDTAPPSTKVDLERQTAGLAHSTVILAVDILQQFLGCDDEQAIRELQTAIHRWQRNQGFQEARAQGLGVAPIDRFDGKNRDHELDEAFEVARNYVSRVFTDGEQNDPHAEQACSNCGASPEFWREPGPAKPAKPARKAKGKR